MKILTLIRGLPGSGKSTLAAAIAALANENVMKETVRYEADMYHTTNGVYKYEPKNVKIAHAWCQDMTRSALMSGLNCVVSNTFTQHWEMKPYLDMAEEFGYKVQIITCQADFGNVQNVPQEVIENMRKRWEN